MTVLGGAAVSYERGTPVILGVVSTFDVAIPETPREDRLLATPLLGIQPRV
jgi:hypothetical protein